MKAKELFELINIDELEIIKMYNDKNNSYMLVEAPIYLELIANGYRPSVEFNPKHLIIFKNKHFDTFDDKKIIISHENFEDYIIIKTNDIDIKIENCDIDFKPNYIFEE